MKTALITGCPGQDAFFLSKLLLEKDYKVIATYRYSSTDFNYRFAGWEAQLSNKNFLATAADITDPRVCNYLINIYKPDEVYNLAAASHVGESFKNPTAVFQINTMPVVYFLDAINLNNPTTKIITASTSELFGSNYSVGENGEKYQDENTPFSPNSPYAVSKLAAHNMIRIYRDSYNVFAATSICHNHESWRRGENFVTRKITKWLANFCLWKLKTLNNGGELKFSDDHIHLNDDSFPKLRLGNIDAVRDWSYAGDMVYGMWQILQQDKPDDYVLCSGVGHSVRDFIYTAFSILNIEDPMSYIVIDPQFYRPCEVPYLRGNCDKAISEIGWMPKVSFKQLVEVMVEKDYNTVMESYNEQCANQT